MDPLTGVIALTGLTVASLAGLRLKKQQNEGFQVVPETGYRNSVRESQSRYNSLTAMVNPLLNPILPGGETEEEVKRKQTDMNLALGSILTPYDPTSPEAFKLKDTLNRLTVRNDAKGGIFNAVKFCREAAEKDSNPFTNYRIDENGNPTGEVAKPGASLQVNEDQTLKFDEVCGICLTSGVDEDGKPFNGRKGMLIDPNVKESALKEQRDFSYPFPRVTPSMGTCEGSPNLPAFAIDGTTLEQYTKRHQCMKTKEIDETNGCGLCYENNTYSFVDKKASKTPISLVLMGVGRCTITIKNETIRQNFALSSTPVTIPLILNQDTWVFDNNTRRWVTQKRVSPANEGDTFTVEVTQTPGKADELPLVFGYMSATNPNGGAFAMPLNLIITRDAVTNSSANKTGGFHMFPENGIEVSKMRPGGLTGTEMKLQGEIPFTFVQSSEFSSFDCPSAPYQTQSASITRFATDQACYAKGTGKGNYNDDCLRERILAAGCTNGGELYQNPKVLNTDANGNPNSLTSIYNTLTDIAANDLIDAEKTRLCSGRNIQNPCLVLASLPDLKIERLLTSSDPQQARNKVLAQKCLSYLYNNKGADENQPGGETYRGSTQFSNRTNTNKSLYCLPEGELNPDRNREASLELARIYDNGFKGSVGIDAVKLYLTTTLEMAVDERRNGNTDPDRRAAIRKCFGTQFKELQAAASTGGNPKVIEDPARYIVRHPINNLEWKVWNQPNKILKLRLNGTPIELDIVSRPDVFKSSEGRVALFVNGDQSRALAPGWPSNVRESPFRPNDPIFSWSLLEAPNNSVFFHTDYDRGFIIGHQDDGSNTQGAEYLMLVRPGDSKSVAWKIDPYPRTFVRKNDALLVAQRPTITFAWYGSVYKFLGTNVTQKVVSDFNAGARGIAATNANFGDPLPGIRKTLYVDYSLPFDNTVYHINISEGNTFDFSWLQRASSTRRPDPTDYEKGLRKNYVPSLGNRLGSVYNNGDYELVFDIFPKGVTPDWGGIVHFNMTGNNCCNPGDRMPAIWFFPGSLRLHVRIGDRNDGNWGTDTQTSCVLNTWNKFSLRCQGQNVTLRLNNEVQQLRQPSSRIRGTATVFTPFNIHNPANADIANFSFTTLNR